MPHKPLRSKAKPATGTIALWQPLIDAAQRAPSETKQSIQEMRVIGLLDDTHVNFIIAALGIGGV